MTRAGDVGADNIAGDPGEGGPVDDDDPVDAVPGDDVARLAASPAPSPSVPTRVPRAPVSTWTPECAVAQGGEAGRVDADVVSGEQYVLGAGGSASITIVSLMASPVVTFPWTRPWKHSRRRAPSGCS